VRFSACFPLQAGIVAPNFVDIIPNFAYFFNKNLAIKNLATKAQRDEDIITAENAEGAEYISICIYTYGVHYVLRQRLHRFARLENTTKNSPQRTWRAQRHKWRNSARGGGESWPVARGS